MIAYLGFILIALCAYFNALSLPFVHDEIVLILKNPNIAHFSDMFRVFFAPSGLPFEGNTYYRPVLELLYRIEYFFYGFNPLGWHAFNIVLHGINGALVMRLIQALGFNRGVALAVAILFVVHPIQTESVACVAGVSNVLMAFFVLLSLIAYLKDRTISSVFYLVVALMTKEQAIMIVPLFLLMDWYRGKKHAVRLGVFASVVVIFLIIRQNLTGSHVLADIFASPGELKLRVLSIAKVLLTNIRLLILPYDLHYYRSTDILATYWSWWAGLGIALLVLIRFNLRFVWFGVAFFFLALLPVLNIVPMVNEYALILSMEHFLYVPMIGIMLVLVCTIAHFCRKHTEQIFLIFVTCFFFITLTQNEFWRSEIILFERTVAYEPEFGRGHYLLARAYYFDNHYVDANEHFAKSYAIMDGYSRKAVGAQAKAFYDRYKKDILFDWAHSYEAMGYWNLAERKYRQAIDIDPNDPRLWDNLGVVYVQTGKSNESIEYFEKALMVDPNFKLAQEHLKQIK